MKTTLKQHGLTLVELMIALTLGMFVILAVTGLVISSKSTQSTQNDAASIQDTGRFALDNISRSIKQAGYVNFDKEDAPLVNTESMTPSIMGIDASSLKKTTYGIDSPIGKSINSSDVLALRFFGSGNPADNTILNCAGFGVPAPTSQINAEVERGWSIYYVADDVGGEPALFCKYRGKSGVVSDAIARGVESFQVLYGVDTSSPANAIANRFLSAKEITALDSGISKAALNKNTHWKKITAIKVAMLIRGAENSRLDLSTTTHHLFGRDYSDSMGAHDKGTQIKETDIPISQRKRLRKVVSTTIQLRNSVD